MKKLFFILTALFAAFFTAAAQEKPNIRFSQAISIKSAQGEVNEAYASDKISALGYTVNNMNGMNFYLVKDLSLLTKEKYPFDFGGADNYEELNFSGNNATINATKFPVSIDRYVSFRPNTNDVTGFSLKVNYEGKTREETQEFYLIASLLSIVNNGIDLIAIPVRVETYNSFRYLDYPSIAGTDLENYCIADPYRENIYLSKEADGSHIIASHQKKISQDGVYSEENNPTSLFQVFQSQSLAKGKALSLCHYYDESNNQRHFLTYDENSLYAVYDISQGYGSRHFLKTISFDELSQDANAMPLEVIPQADGSCVVRTRQMTKTRWIDEDGGDGHYEDFFAYIYLDYNAASGDFGLIYEESQNAGTNLDDSHKLFLYHEVLREDNTPHFQPHNGQVTSINGGDPEADPALAGTANPLVIEMTFDRPLKFDAATGELLDKNGNPLKNSELFKVIVEDNSDWTPNASLAPARDGILKAPRKVLVNSTNIKAGTTNVAVVNLESSYFNTTAPANAPQLPNGPLKAPRKVLVNSTNVKVVAQAGAIAYSDASSRPQYAMSRAGSDEATCLAEETATTAFAFEYTIVATNSENRDEIIQGSRVNVTVGAGGISTFYTDGSNPIDPRSTDQLKFYRVSAVAEGEITLTQIKEIACGPMMVKGKPNRTVTVDKDKDRMEIGYAGNFLRYCAKPEGQGSIPYYCGWDLVNDNSETLTRLYGAQNEYKAFNYIFGRKKISENVYDELGFYHFVMKEPTSPNDPPYWMNTTNKDFVYLHSYLDLKPANGAAKIKMLLENGEEIGVSTAISTLFAEGNPQTKPTALYNAMGQAVNESYQGIVIRGNKKVINK